MPSILDILKSIETTPTQIGQFEQLLYVKNITKGEILLRKGDISKKSYFVKKGCLRSYSIDQKGKEHVFMFAPECWIVSDVTTQSKNMPSDLFIDALEDSEVEVFDHRLFDLAASLLPNTNTFGNEKLINRMAVLQKRIIMLMSATALNKLACWVQNGTPQ